MSRDNELSNIIRDLRHMENYSREPSNDELLDMHRRIVQLPRTARRQLYRDKEYVPLEEILDWQQTCPKDKRITDAGTNSEEDIRIAFEINKIVAIWRGRPLTIECDALLLPFSESVTIGGSATRIGRFTICRACQLPANNTYEIRTRYINEGDIIDFLTIAAQSGYRSLVIDLDTLLHQAYVAAAHNIMTAVNKWLEENYSLVDKIIFCAMQSLARMMSSHFPVFEVNIPERKIPVEILRKGSRATQIYKKALSYDKHAVQNIRVMLVGQSGVGKTTLLKRLLGQDVDIKKIENTEGIEVHVNRCKIDVESGRWHCQVRPQSSSSESDDTKVDQQNKELMETYGNSKNLSDSNFANVSFWDFAGQYIFYNTHQAFLSPRTVYLLVTKLKHTLDEAGPQRQDCDTTMHNTIEFWVNSIHFICGKESHDPSVPPVILVATHADTVDQAQKEILIHNHFQNVRDIFANKITAGHIINDLEFAVDNTVEDPRLKGLKKAILEVAKTQYYWQEEHPVHWQTLENELFVKENSGEKVLQLEAVKNINRMLRFPLKEAELDLFLQFQSDLGNILYISEGELKDYVLLNPQWVADAFKCIITAEENLDCKIDLRVDWKQAKVTGKINTKLIEAVWRDKKSERFFEERKFLFLLLQQLNLIARPIGTEQPLSHYFVPCLITERPSCLPIPFKGEATSVLTLSAAPRFFPLILFHKLIASCIQKYRIHKERIYDNSALFEDGVHVFTVLYVDNTVKVWVNNLDNAIPESKVCQRVLKFLIECINQLLQLSCSKTQSVAIFICCPEVEVYSLQGMHQLPNDTHLWQAQSSEKVLCSNERCESHSISIGDALKHWIPGPTNAEDQTYKKALSKAWRRLVEKMDSGELLDTFMEKELLSPVAIRDLRDEKNTSQRNRAVLEKVSIMGSEKYEVFKECLTMTKQEHLAQLLYDYEREIAA